MSGKAGHLLSTPVKDQDQVSNEFRKPLEVSASHVSGALPALSHIQVIGGNG